MILRDFEDPRLQLGKEDYCLRRKAPAGDVILQLAHQQRQGARPLTDDPRPDNEALEGLNIMVALERVLLEDGDDERLDLRHSHCAAQA